MKFPPKLLKEDSCDSGYASLAITPEDAATVRLRELDGLASTVCLQELECPPTSHPGNVLFKTSDAINMSEVGHIRIVKIRIQC